MNTTLCFSAIQAVIAAKAGASYISPFVGRLDAVGNEGMELVRQIRRIYDLYSFKTKIIAAALRHPMHVLDSALAGAEIATMSFAIMDQLFQHPLTDLGLQQFLNDWQKYKEAV